MLELDAVLFEQALFNLLDNAAKYSPAGSTISDPRAGETAIRVILQIFDEGGGIPPEDLERIFDKFYRVQKGDQVRPGTGLGLAIARGFVEAMNGSISAANRTDRAGPCSPSGCRFRRSRRAGYRRMSASRMKILVIDDEPPIRKLLRLGLEHARL